MFFRSFWRRQAYFHHFFQTFKNLAKQFFNKNFISKNRKLSTNNLLYSQISKLLFFAFNTKIKLLFSPNNHFSVFTQFSSVKFNLAFTLPSLSHRSTEARRDYNYIKNHTNDIFLHNTINHVRRIFPDEMSSNYIFAFFFVPRAST